jgi:hypothetical protein
MKRAERAATVKKRARMLALLSAAGVAVAIASAAALRASARARLASSSSAIESPVRELVSAVPFRVEIPFVHDWRSEHPLVSAGYLLVLAVDPELVRPRETAEPVLYAGDQTVERVNHGFESGRVVAILPVSSATLDAGDRSALDLARTDFWFGAPDLPERVDAQEIHRQRERVAANRVRRFSAAEIAAARARGGEELALARREDLEARAGLLVLEHSPAEHDLGSGLLVPPGK